MTRTLLAVTAVIALAASAQAGFLSFDCTFPDDPLTEHHDWTFVNDQPVPELTLAEAIPAIGPDQVIMSGETNVDPTFHVVKDILNNTGITWTGYTLTLTGPGATFGPTASSSHFGDITVSSNEIVFSQPLSVPHGDTVSLEFDINVATVGLFEFTLTQNPIPEPATLALLSLGGIFLRRRR